VIVRADLDISPGEIPDLSSNLRIKSLFETLDYIKESGGSIVLIGHRGRPDGRPSESLSLKPFGRFFERWGVCLEENLRFDPGEESNDPNFALKIARLGDFFVNEAFAASHREHASIVGLPRILPHAAGFHFALEVEKLSRVFDGDRRPTVMVISGFKDDKLSHIEDFLRISDKVLIGGRLPAYIHDDSPLRKNEKVIVADLVADKEDITINSIESFCGAIGAARTIVVSGPVGKFEEEGHRQGTRDVFESIARAQAYKVAGGGDTEIAIELLGLSGKFDWISVGGGAMLAFLAKGTLPGIDALR
jgi:phosphoglycerate kinase